MTKEEIIFLEEVCHYCNFLDIDETKGLEVKFEKFFSQNVCIPKGVNRHPYADVLHKMAEDMTKSFQVKYIHQDLGWSTFDSYTDYAFREKPQEQVYEYLWYKEDGAINWMTIEEAKMTKIEWYCAIETKRVR